MKAFDPDKAVRMATLTALKGAKPAALPPPPADLVKQVGDLSPAQKVAPPTPGTMLINRALEAVKNAQDPRPEHRDGGAVTVDATGPLLKVIGDLVKVMLDQQAAITELVETLAAPQQIIRDDDHRITEVRRERKRET